MAVDNKLAVAVLSALAFETRLLAVQILSSAGEQGLPAGELARQLGVRQNTLSDHLRALAYAEIIIPERQGRSIVYRANPTTLPGLIEFLGKTCAGGE